MAMAINNFPTGPFEDYVGNPILFPSTGFQCKGVYNPTVIKEGNLFWMLYRAEGDDGLTGRIGLAKSRDGFHFTPHPEPVLSPSDEFDIEGCEDPRVAKFEDTYFLIYVGNSKKYQVSNICLASSKDLFHWKKHGPIMEAEQGTWDEGQLKAGVIVPEKIEGRYILYYMGEESPWVTAIGAAYSDDLFHWHKLVDEPVLSPREGFFDSKGIEPGPNPVLIDEGIFLIYNGWGEDSVYKPGGALFSKYDPTKALERTEEPLLTLSRDYGKEYCSSNHCVAEGLLKHGKEWLLYYGAADKLVCMAVCQQKE